MRPMLAVPASRPGVPPAGDGWVHEVKWDGMRVLVDVRGGEVRVWSRNERDVTASYPEFAGLGEAYDDMLLDAEVVARIPRLLRHSRHARVGGLRAGPGDPWGGHAVAQGVRARQERGMHDAG